MKGKNTLKPADAKRIRKEIEKVIKNHGFDHVRRVFNRYVEMKRLQKTMLRTKKALQEELADVTRRLGAR